MIGKNKMKDWKQAVITWEKRNYKKPTMSKLGFTNKCLAKKQRNYYEKLIDYFYFINFIKLLHTKKS